MPLRPERRSLRMPGYDYSQPGSYFITICTANRRLLFGRVKNGRMVLNTEGTLVEKTWPWLLDRYPHVRIEASVIMPNQVHAVLAWDRHSDPPQPLGALVGAFKATSSKSINASRGTSQVAVWQRSYFEHVVADDADLYTIRTYIDQNPATWSLDHENPVSQASRTT